MRPVVRRSILVTMVMAAMLGGIACAPRLTTAVPPEAHVPAPGRATAPAVTARSAYPSAPLSPAANVHASIETQDQLPCTQQTLEASGVRQQLLDLDAAIEALPTDREDPSAVLTVSRTLRKLSDSPCFRLFPEAEIPNTNLTGTGLRWFWAHGGRAWAMQVLDDAPSSRVTPPPVPESLRFETLPAPQRIFLCRNATCQLDTASWRIRAERTINAIGQEPAYTARRRCRRALSVPGWSEFDLELECAAAEAGFTWLLPLGAIAAVKDGVLTTTASRAGCDEWRAFDISSGRAAWLTKCGTEAPRIGLGRVYTEPLRESIFALFIAPHVNWGPTATTITIPPAIRPLSTLGQFPRGVDARAGGSSRQVQHSLSYLRNGAEVLSGKIYWPQDLTYPEQVYLTWLLDMVDASWQGDCISTREYRSLAAVLARAFPVLIGALAPLRDGKPFACETSPLLRFGDPSE